MQSSDALRISIIIAVLTEGKSRVTCDLLMPDTTIGAERVKLLNGRAPFPTADPGARTPASHMEIRARALAEANHLHLTRIHNATGRANDIPSYYEFSLPDFKANTHCQLEDCFIRDGKADNLIYRSTTGESLYVCADHAQQAVRTRGAVRLAIRGASTSVKFNELDALIFLVQHHCAVSFQPGFDASDLHIVLMQETNSNLRYRLGRHVALNAFYQYPWQVIADVVTEFADGMFKAKAQA